MEEIKVEKDVYDFLYYTCFGAEKNIYDMAIERAYRDVQRTVRWTTNNNKKRDETKTAAKNLIKKDIIEIVRQTNLTSQQFDQWHENLCRKLVSFFKDNGYEFCIGQAQKWINMSFKYLYIIDSSVIEEIIPVLHIPIDNDIFDALKEEKGALEFSGNWNKFDDYERYINFQKWFAKQGYEYPLKREFKLWEKLLKKTAVK